jgi:hypothetical protein
LRSSMRSPLAAIFPFAFWPAILLVWTVFVFPFTTFAQSTLTDVVGVPPDAAMYSIPGVGSVNLRNGNLHIEIPIWAVKERNGSTMTTNILYDNSTYQIVQEKTVSGTGTVPYWSTVPGDYPAWASGLNQRQPDPLQREQ